MICFGQKKEQKENFKAVIEGPAAKIMKSKKAIAMEQNNMETFEWLWQKYVGKPWSPNTDFISKGDMRVFDKGVTEWLNSLTYREGWFGRNFKLPRVLAKNFKGGDDFVRNLGESISYNQRQLKEGSKLVNRMMDGFYSMFNDSKSQIIMDAKQNWSKSDYKKFQGLERKLMQSVTKEQRIEAIKELDNYMGKIVDGNTLGAKILNRFRDILVGKVPQTEMTKNEDSINTAWNILRVDSMRNLLNAAISARRTIETLKGDVHQPHLQRAFENINKHIEALLIKGDASNKEIVNQYKLDEGFVRIRDKNEFQVYDPKTKRIQQYRSKDQETGETIIAMKKYLPTYVIELTDLMHNLTSYSKAIDKANYKNMTPEQLANNIERQLNPEAISNRLKTAGQTELRQAMDPLYYLNKYVNDVASFNLRSRINHAYSVATKDIIKNIRNNNTKKGNADVGEYSRYLLETLAEIKENALVQNGGPTDVMDHAVRLINGFEYISKLGFSVKGGIKNRTQAALNWVKYGTRGYNMSRDFYNTSSREYDPGSKVEYTNSAMKDRQMKRFGFMVGDKAKMSNVAAATGGSIDMLLVPKGFDIDASGRLIIASKDSKMKRAADAMSWATEKSSGMMAWAENKNRISTFEMAFAHSFLAEKNRIEHHRQQYFKENGKQPKNSQLYDRIERLAGNQALEMVKMLHYDYDNWAKAKILRSKGGKVIGQYQHFKFAFFDMQYNILRNALRDVKGFRFKEQDPLDPSGKKMKVSQNIQEAMRLSAIYSFVPGLVGLVTDFDVGGVMSTFGIAPFQEDRDTKGDISQTGLIENPVIEEIAKFLDFFGNSPDGDEYESLKHYNAYYGRNPITANLGPFMSDVMTAAELMDFINLTGDEYAEARNLNYDPDNPDWWYNVARIFSVQGSRTAYKSMPALLKGQYEKAFRIETGMYKPKWITKWRSVQKEKIAKSLFNSNNFLPDVNFDSSSNREQERRRQKALASLSLL